MEQGISTLSVVPMRAEPADKSEMTNQVLFGESYQILEERAQWIKVKLQHDGYEGWLDRKQHHPLSSAHARAINKGPMAITADLIELITQEKTGQFFPVFLGSLLPGFDSAQKTLQIGDVKFQFQGAIQNPENNRQKLIETAFLYQHAPYLWGGRSPAGIDCSGFTQMVYRLAGTSLPRDAGQQVERGLALSFIEEAEPGDLAFFDNEEGRITHVGIILEDNYILHASGRVRLDRLDQSGIFNPEERRHTHKLRVIKKIL